MTRREEEILKLLREDPLISQKALAEKLGVERASVASYISQLMKKGFIKGRGYILNSPKYCLIIGNSYVNIVARPKDNLRLYEENIGFVEIELGGTGRNTAVYANELGEEVRLLSAFAGDVNGKKMKKDLKERGIDFALSYEDGNVGSCMKLSVVDENGHMEIQVSQMDLINGITEGYIRKNKGAIINANKLVLDARLNFDTVECICNIKSNKTPILFNMSIAEKSVQFRPLTKKFDTIVLRKVEAEVLLGIKIKNYQDLRNGINRILKDGVRRVVMPLNEDGIIYATNTSIYKGKSLNSIPVTSKAKEKILAALLVLDKYELKIERQVAGLCKIMEMRETELKDFDKLINGLEFEKMFEIKEI